MIRANAIYFTKEYLRARGLKAWKYSHFHKLWGQSGYYGIVAYIAHHPGRTMDLQISPTGKVRHA